LEQILRRQRLMIAAGLAAVVLAAWLYLVHDKTAMPWMDPPGIAMSGMNMPGMAMPGMIMPQPATSSISTFLLLFVMWAVMMVAMMVPSAAPMVLTFASVNQRRRAANRPFVPVGIFLLGYLLVWTGYSAVAAFLQWRLHEAALLSPAMAARSPLLSGGLLIAAGIFQWTPLKRVCLQGCRSPLSFLLAEWREGGGGALMMGLRHGAYCVGCCWALMALLFVAGVMNLLWVAVIALFVMAEKLVAKGEWIARLAGVLLIAAGIGVIARII
jgi:predicted metal-binding membrane protein